MRGLFITATGTDAGKTLVSRMLVLSARARGQRVAALKPLETGFVDPTKSDAFALAQSAARPELAWAPGLYRARLPLAPAAAVLEGEAPPPSVEGLAQSCRDAARDSDFVLVEGAGGLLVPLSERATVADLASALALPLLLVAPDGLGVLSHVLTAVESAERRNLPVRAVVLSGANTRGDDPSPRTNQTLLAERLSCPVHRLPRLPATDDPSLEAATPDWIPTLL